MSNITFQEFAQKFSDELEIDLEVALNEKLSSMSSYDSMAQINLSLLIEEIFDFQIKHDELQSVDTLMALYELCCRG